MGKRLGMAMMGKCVTWRFGNCEAANHNISVAANRKSNRVTCPPFGDSVSEIASGRSSIPQKKIKTL